MICGYINSKAAVNRIRLISLCEFIIAFVCGLFTLTSQGSDRAVKGSSTIIAMEGKTFVFVVFSGLCFLPACFPREYVLVRKALPWAEARSYCRETYTDLASAHNNKELARLVDTAQPYHTGHVWIGLYDDVDSWRWSLEKEGYYGEGEAEFRMWYKDAPDNYRGFQNCAAMQFNGSWNDLHCGHQTQFVCYNGNEGTETSSSFIFVNMSRTWREAQRFCRDHYTDLASVRNKTENDQILNLTHNQKIWIGLRRDGWKWSDGSSTSFRNWNSNNNEPNGNYNTPCVLAHRGKWEDATCDRTLFFVCQIVHMKQRMVKVKVTEKDSSVNLEDAATAILQQFNQTLKDHGLSEDMKLTWRKQPDGKIFNVEEEKENKKTGCNLK